MREILNLKVNRIKRIKVATNFKEEIPYWLHSTHEKVDFLMPFSLSWTDFFLNYNGRIINWKSCKHSKLYSSEPISEWEVEEEENRSTNELSNILGG